LHDGGASLSVMVNGQMSCDSVAKYGESSEYKFTGMKMGAAGGVATDHISTMIPCYHEENKVTTLSPDQTWQIKGNYDYDTYAGNKNEKGKQEGIMAM
jgi:hypothetical protein